MVRLVCAWDFMYRCACAPSNVVAVIDGVLNQRGKQANIRKLLAKELARNPLILVLPGLARNSAP